MLRFKFQGKILSCITINSAWTLHKYDVKLFVPVKYNNKCHAVLNFFKINYKIYRL